MTVHPASQRLTTDSRDMFANLGTICPFLAIGGKKGQSISQSCVDDILSPFGIIAVMGLLDFRIFLTSACIEIKFPVVPESNIPKLCLTYSSVVFCWWCLVALLIMWLGYGLSDVLKLSLQLLSAPSSQAEDYWLGK